MKTCCVIVTYSDRFHLISKVLNSLLSHPVDEVIIIDNASKESSKTKLKNFLKNYSIPTNLIEFETNCGSAKGFKEGILNAIKSSCDFVWLLDDDNMPLENSLKLLHNFWNESKIIEKEKKLAILSNREDRTEFILAINKNEPSMVLPPENSFLGFNISTLGNKVFERIISKKIQNKASQRVGKVIAAPYGGLFFHKEIISNNLSPNEDYYLYLDDFDFTYNFTKNGGEIWMIADSKIKDIEQSSYITKKKGLLYHSIFDAKNDFVTYYANRNLCYMQLKYLVNNHLVYSINKGLFLLYIFTLGTIRCKFSRLKILLESITDAKKNRLGRNPKYLI